MPVRLWILAIFAVLFLWLIVRGIRNGDLRERSGWTIPIAFLTLIIIPTGLFEMRWQHHEDLGTRIVKQVSQNPEGYLYCQRLSESFVDATASKLGWVDANAPNRAFVKHGICQDLNGWIDQNYFKGANEPYSRPDIKQINAVAVIIHEGYHVGGDYNEASTQCKTLKALPEVLQVVFKLPYEEALLATTKYRDEIHVNMSQEYQGGRC